MLDITFVEKVTLASYDRGGTFSVVCRRFYRIFFDFVERQQSFDIAPT